MNDEQLRAAYERGLPSGGDRRPLDDVEADQLRRVVDREGDEAERVHALDTLLSTAEGRRELEIVWSASRAARPQATRSIWWQVAAGIVLLVGVGTTWTTLRRAPEDVPRSLPSSLELLAPRGTVAAGDVMRFTWSAVPGLERYTLTVVDTAGNSLFTVETRDTTAVAPAGAPLAAGSAFLWWVTGRTASGEQRVAQPVRVRVRSR